MRKTNFRWQNMLAILLSLLLILAVPVLAKPTRRAYHPEEPAMALHHVHTLLGQGLVTVLQGADMLMIADMRMASGLDGVTAKHGAEMVTQGKALIKEVLSGASMKEMHEKGHWQDDMMGYTHQLGAEVLALVDDEQAMLSAGGVSPEAMSLHHVHLALNHALEMSAQAANLVMLGKMKMAGSLDEQSAARGRAMAADARLLWDTVLGGEAMKALQGGEKSGQPSEQMAQTNRIVKHGAKIMKLLEEMESLK